ncbi:T9SS type A sorting domain-containing protein [uncultured Polaribacter sp.]|uniref:T9SS type A sorting domain-containing protein n=1 Tax=uncultured Polaribacter sp. TaxID=174711 RepID=UPI002624EF40|nr:T9SS type A sorting domain-containing protein [uncultured Polaribacter sp.]
MIRTHCFLFALILCFVSTFAQTGPGGVGKTDGSSNLVLWLNPDKGSNTGNTWTDQSGNGYDFSSSNGATLNTADVNGYNSYLFNGNNNFFDKSFESDLNPSTFSIFAVNNINSTTDYKAVISSRDASSGKKGFILYSYPDSNEWVFWTGSTSIREWLKTFSGTSTVGSWTIQSIFYKSGTNGKRIFINNTLKGTSSGEMTLNTTKPFRVGAGANDQNPPKFYFNGKMGDIIMFNTVLNTAKRIIVNNYLASKYGFSLSSDDYYDEDTPTNGNFDHHVAGIGQATDGSNHTDSKGTGIVRMNTPSNLNDDDFLFWGSNTKGNLTFAATTNNYKEIISAKWRVSKRNNLGTVSVVVDLSGINLSNKPSCANLKLIVDNDSDLLSPTASYNLLPIGTDLYQANNVAFLDNDYFTIEFPKQIVLDNTQFYNGSGTANAPSVSDNCLKLLVKSTADGSVQLTENASVKDVEVETGGTLVVASAKSVTVANGIQLDGEIRLIGDAQLIQMQNGGSQVTGSGNLYRDQQSITVNTYQSGYWSSPVTTNGATYTISGVLKDGSSPTTASTNPPNINFTDIHTLDGSKTSPITISGRWLAKHVDDTNWTYPISPTTEQLNPGEGFNMKSTGGGVQNFTFKGIPNDGTYTSTINSGNYSLLGNPYPSAIDADIFLTDNQNAIDGTLYFYNSSATDNSHYVGEYSGGYATRVIGMGTPFNGGISPQKFIPVGQGFFVGRTSSGSGVVEFNNGQRVFETLGANSTFFSRSSVTNSSFPLLRIGFEFNTSDTETYKRQLAIGFRGLTQGFENGYDAIMFDKKPTDIALKVDDKEEPFVITGIENYNSDLVIPLSVYASELKEVTFKLDEKYGISENVYLKDKQTDLIYNLSDTNATLTLSPGNYDDRFYVAFKESVLNLEENQLLNTHFTVSHNRNNKKLSVVNNSNSLVKKISIYNFLGQQVATVNTQEKLKLKKIILSTTLLKEAIYFISITTDKGVINKKFY